MVDWLAGWLVDFWIVVWVGGRSDEHYVFCEALVVKGEGVFMYTWMEVEEVLTHIQML